MDEKKQRKGGKRQEQRKNDIKGILSAFPVLKEVFQIEYPEVTVDDILGCNPNAILQVYDFFLRCLSLVSFEELYDSELQNAILTKPDPCGKSRADATHMIRFFFVVREMFRLLGGAKFVLKDLTHPELSRTVMFFKKTFSFIQFYCRNNLKYQNEIDEENSGNREVAILRKEVKELRERDEMLDAKIRMEEVAKGQLQEDMMVLNSDIELYEKKIQLAKNELQECDKEALITQDRVNEAELYLLDVKRNTEKQDNEVVTSPDRLLEQKIASEKLIEALYAEMKGLEIEIVNRKKNIGALDSNVPELEILHQSCSEIKPLVQQMDIEKQKHNELILRKEEKQMKLEGLVQDIAVSNKNLKNLKDRYDLLLSILKKL